MKVQVTTESWSLKEVEGVKKIVGNYKIMCGATEIAKQDFNDGYGATTLIFPTELVLECEQLGRKIEAAIAKNFTGGE